MLALKSWATEQGLPGEAPALLKDKKVQELIGTELERWSADWKGYERVKKFELLGEEFTTANDMLTPSLKLKRRNVLKTYEKQIADLYR